MIDCKKLLTVWAEFAVASTVVALLSGCGSTQQTASTSGAINTGTFPNLNIPPQAAAQPLSAEQTAKLQSNVTAAQAAQTARANGTPPATDPAALKKVGDQHGPDTLKAIEDK